MRVVMIGPFGFKAKSTMRERALPMARALVKRGHEVVIVVPPWDSPEEAGHEWQDQGVRIINTALPQTQGLVFYTQLTSWLVHTALAFNPDVIHLFKPKAYAGLAHLLLRSLRHLKQHRAKLVVDEDDLEQAWNEKNDYTPLQKWFFAWQEPWGLKHADAITVASKALYRYAADLKIPLHKIRYVPNGVRPMESSLTLLKTFPSWREEFTLVTAGEQTCYGLPLQRAKLNPLSGLPQQPPDLSDFEGRIRAKYDLFGRPIILIYTRFVEFQVSALVNIIAKVKVLLPEAHWLIVGQGYFQEEAELFRLARADNLDNKITLAGWVPQLELPHYFSAANVALHLYDDTPINRTKCSVRLLDLLSAGVPVVASRVGQNAEYITHNQTGILVPPGDILMTAEALAALANNHRLQQKLSQRAACYVNRIFNWDALAGRVEAAYTA